jgi:hypothetical protein
MRQKLIGTMEAELMKWSTALTEKEYREQVSLIARRLSLCAREWFHEIAPVRLKMQARRFADSPERGSFQLDSPV